MARKPTTYWEYLQLETLLGLQSGIDGDEAKLSNDEVLFITVHQIDELWFKLAVRELVSLRNNFAQAPVPEQSLAAAARSCRRLAVLFHHLAQHFEVMETMTTRDYLAFRDKLSPASGFQSAQLREVEILMGLDANARIPLGHESSYLDALKNPDGTESFASKKVAHRLADRPSLKQGIDEWLHRTPIQGSSPESPNDTETVRRFIEAFLKSQAAEVAAANAIARDDARNDEDRARLEQRYARETSGARAWLFAEDAPANERARTSRIRAAMVFVESYRELPLLAWPREVLDALVLLEQSFLVFRQRHARMVERMIGRRTGTGGSAGVEYLDSTALKYRVFADLWAARTILIRRDALPPLERPEFYGFAAS
jgi:tryptophan 2,3-dioxygenase